MASRIKKFDYERSFTLRRYTKLLFETFPSQPSLFQNPITISTGPREDSSTNQSLTEKGIADIALIISVLPLVGVGIKSIKVNNEAKEQNVLQYVDALAILVTYFRHCCSRTKKLI